MKRTTQELTYFTALLSLIAGGNLMFAKPAKAAGTFNNPRHYIGNTYWTIDWCMPSLLLKALLEANLPSLLWQQEWVRRSLFSCLEHD